jgi:transcription elongation GreA/GreB family factor
MAKRKYTVSSPEGAAFTGAEEGEEVTLELDEERETALVAAGWLEHDKKAKEASK